MILSYSVEYNINGELRADAPASLVDPEGLIQMTDEDNLLKRIEGDGKARVNIGLSQKIGGPHYSSVSLHASVQLTCGQDEDLIDEAQQAALDVVSVFIGTYIPKCYEHLLTILKELPQ